MFIVTGLSSDNLALLILAMNVAGIVTHQARAEWA